MIKIIPFIVLIIDILAVLDVLKREYDTEKRILWIAIIILLPFFGALAWFLLKRR